MRRIIMLSIMAIAVLTAGNVYALGTQAGTLITNFSCEIVYSNTGGTGYTNQAAPVTNTVTNAHDMNSITNNAGPSIVQTGAAGSQLTWSFGAVTNLGNLSDLITITVETNVYNPAAWTACPFDILTNGAVAASGNDLVTYTQTLSVGASIGSLQVRVSINAGVPNGGTNMFTVSIGDGAMTAGDSWPGADALSPSVVDTANERDYQVINLVARVTGPIITISKTATNISSPGNQLKPYEYIQYAIKYTNSGGDTAVGVRIEDLIPPNTVLVTNSASNANSVTATVSYLESGSWVGVDQATTIANTNITMVRWVLSSNDTQVGDSGVLRFTVQVR